MATDMLHAGVPIPIVSRRLDHRRISTTLDFYAHATPASTVSPPRPCATNSADEGRNNINIFPFPPHSMTGDASLEVEGATRRRLGDTARRRPRGTELSAFVFRAWPKDRDTGLCTIDPILVPSSAETESLLDPDAHR